MDTMAARGPEPWRSAAVPGAKHGVRVSLLPLIFPS